MAETSRKKRSEKRKRTCLKAFRIDETELQNFIKNCEAANLNGGDFFREKCCSGKALRPKQRHSAQKANLSNIQYRVMKDQYDMARLGNNLNQIAHGVNVARLNLNDAQLVAVVERHVETLQELVELHQEYLRASNECRDLLRKALLR